MVPCLIIYFLEALHSPPGTIPVLDLVVACAQLVLSLTIITLATDTVKWTSELVAFFNQIVLLEAVLSKKYSIPTRRSQTKLFVANEKPDIFGILANCIVVFCGPLQVVGFIGILWLDVDFAFLPVKLNSVLFSELPVFAKTLFHGLRMILSWTQLMEIFGMARTYSIYAVLLFRGLYLCQTLLASQAVSETRVKELRQLCIVFAILRYFTAVAIAALLCMVYPTIILCNTVILTLNNIMPWYLYTFFLLCWILLTSIAVIVLGLVVAVDQMSCKLREQWKYSCTFLKGNLFRMKYVSRLVRSLKPIGIPYGTLGTFTSTTRTDFFNSIFENSINATLALK